MRGKQPKEREHYVLRMPLVNGSFRTRADSITDNRERRNKVKENVIEIRM